MRLSNEEAYQNNGGNMKRKILLAILLIVASALLFANGSAESKEKEIVTIWHCNTGKTGDAFQTIIDEFNEGIGKDFGIEIEAIYQGKANDVLTKVKASDDKTLPDIAQMDATAATDMNLSEYLVPAANLPISTANFVGSALSAYTSEKGLLALPFNASALLFYYNKTLFDSLTLSVPKTLDEFAAIASKLGETENGKVTRYAFAGIPTTYELTTFIGSQNGLSYLVNNKNGHTGTPTEVLFGTEGTYKAFLEKWKALYDTGYVGNITSSVSTEFAAGRTASMLASSSNLTTVLDSVGDAFEVGVAPVPMVNEKATGGTAIGGGGLFAFDDREATVKVLEYLTSASVQQFWSEATGYFPINAETFDSAEYASFVEENPLFAIAPEYAISSNPLLTNVWLPSAYQIYYSFQSNIQKVTAENMDIDKAVEEMVTIIEDALISYAEQNIN